ncbi:CTLH/CRA C-terminal to LisH motif domain protein [Kalmanozyma brasiliensis GHG001]|uniref:CTLH/CRA C-terminal to LisH motif domain protein n=1 Tax=Kalmanozyma brasiliensis (strain GHG001) TaxID=1365824 RepID=UPI002868020E|nr:CTLH/CRA C-terminal to LisH motif domain protein [Kalmanozyma brasiliensis GHG001]KAF6767484.1 CTLH/CRA C-terminal to LisH motif domain protein [Kalmanozyma brasiliensis GHG001]
MEAVQKSLEQVAKRAPGLHSNSASAKAAATTPSVHDSIDRLIAQVEAAKAALSASSSSSAPNPAVLVAELKSSVESAQKSILDRQKEFHAALSKSTKALDKKFPIPIDGVADPALFSSPEAQTALERVIFNHLQRNGDWSTSYKFAAEAKLPLSPETEALYVQLHNVVAAMARGDLRPAIAWAETERAWLQSRKSGLEFALHRSQFIRIAAGAILPDSDDALTNRDPDGENVEMMSASIDQLHPASTMTNTAVAAAGSALAPPQTNKERALAYGREHFKPFCASHLPEIARLYTLLTFLPDFIPAPAYGPEGLDSVPVEHLLPTVLPIYRPLLDANLVHAPLLEPLFKLEFCARNRIPKDAPLSIGVEVGAGGALNKIIKVKAVMKERGNEWSQADELPIEIPLPTKLRFHSIFACPVSKEQGTEQNPPMMLACGHVLCLETLNRLAKGNGRFKCPYCPTESYLHQAIRVYF